MTSVQGGPESVFAVEQGDVWDAFIAADPGASVCHRWAWRRVFEDVLRHECLYLGTRDGNGRLDAVLPLVEVRSRLFGRYLVSVPFLNYGGVVGSAAGRAALVTRAIGEARRRGADLLELRARGEPQPGIEAVTRKITVVLPLPDSAAALLERFPAKLRSQIRRPQKDGMTARFGPGELEPFYEVFARNMRDLGTPVLSRRFFAGIVDGLADCADVGVVYAGTRPVAAGFGFRWGGEFEMTWASSLREFNRSAPNMLLYWGFMERAIEAGLARFNFGRCTPGGGTHRFKLQWGGVDEPLRWGQWSPRGVSSTPAPVGRFFRTATAVWSRLPVAITRRAGPPLARVLP